MSIIHNGIEIEPSFDILKEKWELDEIINGTKPEKPSLCIFNNTQKLIEMLIKHIRNNSKIALSTDVDMDGAGCTYILDRTLRSFGLNKIISVINKEKVHGIKDKYADYFNNRNHIDLLIITDSSSNDTEIIKKFNCDVICIDHHELSHRELYGKVNDGIHDFIITNNTIDNDNFEQDKLWLQRLNKEDFKNIEKYHGDDRMSCGLVVYEILRILEIILDKENLLENLMLYQWVGVTLFTDAIDLKTKRNQWYIQNTVMSFNREKTLADIMKVINNYKFNQGYGIDKTYIGYTFAPIINKAIRAGASSEALDCILRHPENIENLKKYNEYQEKAINKAIYIYNNEYEPGTELYESSKIKKQFNEPQITYDISCDNTSPSYNGVIAGRMVSEYNKNAASYIRDGDYAVGSFRGRIQGVDYREHFLKTIGTNTNDRFAAGHKTAFGFRLPVNELISIMQDINSSEPLGDVRPFITAGDIPLEKRGTYHITDMDEFKRLGYLWRIAVGNAVVNSQDNIDIVVSAKNVTLDKIVGSTYTYDVLGLKCKAFKQLKGDYFKVYLEYNKDIGFYIK